MKLKVRAGRASAALGGLLVIAMLFSACATANPPSPTAPPAATSAPAASSAPAATKPATQAPVATAAPVTGAKVEVPGVTDDTVLVGMHGPLTGPASWIGLSVRDGFQLALDEINPAGVNGRKIKVQMYDDSNDASQGEVVVKKLIENDKVFMLQAGAGSTTALVGADIASKAGVPYFSSAASPKVLDLKSRWVFNGPTPDNRDLGASDAAFVADYLKVKRPAVLNGADEFATSGADATLAELKARSGVEPIIRQTFKTGDTDFSSQLLAIKNANPDYILLYGLYVEEARIVRQARELGIKIPIKGDAAAMNTGLLSIAGPAAEGMIVQYGPLYAFGDPAPPIAKFEQRFKAKFSSYPPDRPVYTDVHGYTFGFLVAEGLKRAGRDLTRKGFVQAMETLKDWVPSSSWATASDLNPPITYTESHAGQRQQTFFRVTNGVFKPVTDYKAGPLSFKFPPNDSLSW